jgi:uncharacterized membrane protein required for colicin V production
MSFDKLPVNWFDVAILVVLAVGVHRGRRQGMSEELMPVLKWLGIVFGCAFAYEPIGKKIYENSVFSMLSCYVMAYFAAALVIASLFALIKKLIGGKLVGSDVFGRGEYYLGMLAGMTRFACMLIAALALLNARSFNASDIKAAIVVQKQNFGSDFFPTLYTVQSQAFDTSFTGPWIRKGVGFLLIKPTAQVPQEIKRKQIDM